MRLIGKRKEEMKVIMIETWHGPSSVSRWEGKKTHLCGFSESREQTKKFVEKFLNNPGNHIVLPQTKSDLGRMVENYRYGWMYVLPLKDVDEPVHTLLIDGKTVRDGALVAEVHSTLVKGPKAEDMPYNKFYWGPPDKYA